MLTKKEVSKLLKIKGSVRGSALTTDAKYIVDRYDKKTLKKIEEEIKKTGAEIKYNEIKTTEWYPLGWRVISLLVIKEVLDWEEKDIFDMGQAAPKNSFIVRTILKYFASVEKTFFETTVYWKKHYSMGELMAKKIDMDNKFLELQIRNFKIHPYLCLYFQGYFKSVAEMILGDHKVEIKETKCPLKNNSSVHEFLITWK